MFLQTTVRSQKVVHSGTTPRNSAAAAEMPPKEIVWSGLWRCELHSAAHMLPAMSAHARTISQLPCLHTSPSWLAYLTHEAADHCLTMQATWRTKEQTP